MPKRSREDLKIDGALALQRAVASSPEVLAALQRFVAELTPPSESGCESPCGGQKLCGGRHKMFMAAPAAAPFCMSRPAKFASLGAGSTVSIYSYRLGQIQLPCFDRGDGTVDLFSTVPGLAGQPDIIVKAIDAMENRLDVENIAYTLPGLAKRKTTRISIATCKANYDIIQSLSGKKSPTRAESKQLQNAMVYNSAVDMHFLSCQYLEFLHSAVGINNTTNTNVMFSCHNVPNLDNAFFTGQYMVYGNGASMFTPLAVVDVVGHENGHGVNELLSNGMPYQGHSGALNESYADVIGRTFEYWLYNKYNKNDNPADDLPGSDDWLMGEDIAKVNGFLRNMQDPTAASPPQPGTYRGQFWANPNSQEDYGGVHTNSGPANRCFYLLSASRGIDTAFKVYMQTLRSLPASPTYIEFRDGLTAAAAGFAAATETAAALTTVGLTAAAVSDWKK